MSSQMLLNSQQYDAVFIDDTESVHCESVGAHIESYDTTLSAEEIVEAVDIPQDEDERRIDLARRVVLAGGNRTGYSHPCDVQSSLRQCEAVSDDMMRQLGIHEIRFGRFQGDKAKRLKKADTILKWADIHIDNGVLEDIEREQFTDIRLKCDKRIQMQNKQQDVENFMQESPDHVFGAVKLGSELPAKIRVAYRTTFHSADVIAGVIHRANGKYTAAEWIADDLLSEDRVPLEIGYNRLLTTSDDRYEAYKSLYEHLKRTDQ